MKHPFIVYVIACLWCWGTLAPLRGVPLWVLLSGESDSAPAPNPINHAVFAGAQYLRVSASTPSGLSDGQTGTISFWIKPTADSVSYRVLAISRGEGLRLSVARGSTNVIVVQGWNDATTQILDIRSTSTVLASGGWTHVLVCWDLANTSNRKIYLNGVEDTVNAVVYTNSTLDYVITGETRITVGAEGSNTPTGFLNGGLGELWFNDSYNNVIGDYYNAGKAVPLGSNGELPTGSSPVIYLSSSGTGNSWTTNNGTGGSLTKTGTLTTDVDPPDYDE